MLAEMIICRGGVVFGAAFDKDFSVYHIMARTIEELGLLRGSKYVQSNLNQTYREVRSILMKGQTVLFTGTACQIAGLKGYLGKTYDNLLTIDILCHGVPSPTLWEKYLKEKEKQFGSSIRSVSFRHKELGWKSYSMKIEFTDGSIYSKPFYKDSFMRQFVRNLSLRPSCYNCRFRGVNRISDITLGDCWSVEENMPHMFDDKGTSICLIHTKAGEELFTDCLPQMVCEKGNADDILPANVGARKTILAHKNRERFFRALIQSESVDELCAFLEPTVLEKCKYGMIDLLVKVKHTLIPS